LDLDLLIIIFIFLLASKSCLYRLVVAESSYTSLGHGIKSKSHAISQQNKLFQQLNGYPVNGGLTVSDDL